MDLESFQAWRDAPILEICKESVAKHLDGKTHPGVMDSGQWPTGKKGVLLGIQDDKAWDEVRSGDLIVIPESKGKRAKTPDPNSTTNFHAQTQQFKMFRGQVVRTQFVDDYEPKKGLGKKGRHLIILFAAPDPRYTRPEDRRLACLKIAFDMTWPSYIEVHRVDHQST